MSERVVVRPDVRLEDGPMVPVTCAACRARVDVRKSSWEQTSIQWSADAIDTCHERGSADTVDGVGFAGCSALTASIRSAALEGSLPVQIGERLLTNDDPDAAEGHHEVPPW
jgi:hypothetical protein